MALPEKVKLLDAGDVKDSSCLAFAATAAADGEGGIGDITIDCIVAPGNGDVGIANSFPRGAFFHRLRLTWNDAKELFVGVVVSVVAIVDFILQFGLL